MGSHESAISLDAPVTLEELLDRTARETLEAGARDLGVGVCILDRDGRTLLGSVAPPEVVAAHPEFDPEIIAVGDTRYVVSGIMHEGDVMGVVSVGPFRLDAEVGPARRVSAHLVRLADAFIVDGMKRAMSARMHMASLEEANRELTEKNTRLAQAVERLEEADRVKSNFLATVSHELRTPLTSVIGYSEMLMEGIAGELNPEQREYVHTVMEKADQLLQLITGILDISRIEAGGMQLDAQPFDLSEVVSVALSTIAPHARRKKLQVSCFLPDDLPMVKADRDKVRQVLLNLLGNALKFTPEGGSIVIAATPAPLTQTPGGTLGVRISVRDSGIGIPAEHHQQVFDPFFQVDSSSTREYGGTGLGLSIVKRFVEASGGQVWVESAPGKGATFFFTLPLAPPT